MKRMILLVISIMLLLPVVVNAAFSDFAENHWAAPYINELSSKKVINGYEDGTFRPQNTLTKGEFIKLAITASLPNVNFDRVIPKFYHWAGKYVTVAENYGVIDKNEINSKNIDEPINRIDMIRIISACDINIRKALQIPVANMNFSDIAHLEKREIDMLRYAVDAGFINGYEDGTFKPNNNLTRAEISKVLSIYMAKEANV